MLRSPLAFALLLAGTALGADVVVLDEPFGTPIGGGACAPAFPAGWSRDDVDGLTPHPNVAWVDQAWVTVDDPFDATNCTAVSTSWYAEPGASDDWLATPLVHVPRGATLAWRARVEDPNYPDGYEVRYSLVGDTPADFLANPPLFTIADESDAWTSRVVDLDAANVSGRAAYFAFRNPSFDELLLYVDDVVVAVDTALIEEEFGGVDGTGDCAPLFPAGWTPLDADARNPTAETSFVSDAWVAWNEDWFAGGSAECVAISTSDYQPSGQSDDWLMTPLVALPANAEISWRARSGEALFPESYELRYSTGGTATTDFTAHPALATVSGESAGWTSRTVDLDAAGLGGQSVRLAVRNVSNDEFLLLVDSIRISEPLIFRDGFISGSAGAWSAAAGLPP